MPDLGAWQKRILALAAEAEREHQIVVSHVLTSVAAAMVSDGMWGIFVQHVERFNSIARDALAIARKVKA